MLRIGIIGFGFMGRMHYANWNKYQDAKVVAICDSDPNIIDNSKKTCGNIEGAEQITGLDDLKVYTNCENMFTDNIVDAVSITLPTHLHCPFSIEALRAGLHVLCEKPMALNSEQCRQMIAAADKSGKILQIGHCMRFWPEYAKTKQIVESGIYGKVIAATFDRLGSTPEWTAQNWLTNEDYSGGVALDLHIHDSDFVRHLFGLPKSVLSSGCPASGKDLKYITTRYLFDDDKLVTANAAWAMTPSFGFEMSFKIVMEKATIVCSCARQPCFTVYPAEGEPFTPEVAKGDAYSRQIEYFAGLISGRKLPEVITIRQSSDSIRLVRAEIESIQKNSRITL